MKPPTVRKHPPLMGAACRRTKYSLRPQPLPRRRRLLRVLPVDRGGPRTVVLATHETVPEGACC